MKIRKATSKDISKYILLRTDSLKDYQKLTEEKLSLSKKQIEKEFFDTLSNKKRIIFFLEEGSIVCGYLMGRVNGTSSNIKTYIDDIVVSNNLRGKGYSKILMREFEKWSRLKKANKIQLGVRANNKVAIKIYEKDKFRITHFEMEKKLK